MSGQQREGAGFLLWPSDGVEWGGVDGMGWNGVEWEVEQQEGERICWGTESIGLKRTKENDESWDIFLKNIRVRV